MASISVRSEKPISLPVAKVSSLVARFLAKVSASASKVIAELQIIPRTCLSIGKLASSVDLAT